MSKCRPLTFDTFSSCRKMRTFTVCFIITLLLVKVLAQKYAGNGVDECRTNISPSCPYGPFPLTLSGSPASGILFPRDSGIGNVSLPMTYFFTIPSASQMPNGSQFTLMIKADLGAGGDLCYNVMIGDDSDADCMGESNGGMLVTEYTQNITSVDDTLGVINVFCGKSCVGPIKYVISLQAHIPTQVCSLMLVTHLGKAKSTCCNS